MYANFEEIKKAVMHEKDRNCCTVVATAFACDVRFSKAKRALASIAGRRKGQGVVFRRFHDDVFESFNKRLVQDMTWGGYPTVTSLERWANKTENKNKIFLVYVRGHVLTIKHGEVMDWTQGRRHKVQAVYEVLPIIEEQ